MVRSGARMRSLLVAAAVFSQAPAAGAKAPPNLPTVAQIDAVVRQHLGDLDACRRRLGVTGRLDVQLQVQSTGKVSGTGVVEDTVGSPALRECVQKAVERWSFPRFSQPWFAVTELFTFDRAGVTMDDDEGGGPTVSLIDSPRAFLLRFGARFVPLACVVGNKSFFGRACNDAIARQPILGIQPGYLTGESNVMVGPDVVRFEFDRVDALGFSTASWPGPPPGARGRYISPGPCDGFATWPARGFKVELSPHGERVFRDGVAERCADEPWLQCPEANRKSPVMAPRGLEDAAPAWDGPRGGEAARLIASETRRYKRTSAPRLLQSFSLDLDGDGVAEHLHNAVVTDLEVPTDSEGRIEFEPPNELYFLFVERGGHLARLRVDTRASRADGMDGAVVGWLDMDGDGRPELWLDTPRYEGLTRQLVRFDRGTLRGIAELGFEYYGEAPGAPSD